MKRKLLIVLSVCTLAFPVAAYADEKDDRIAELEAQVKEMQATIDDLREQLSSYTKSSEQDVYKIGDTWEVAGQWKVTINSVEETEERNEYADTNPAAVYLINYTYENIDYKDDSGIMNGLFIDFSDGIVDAAGVMGYAYPGDLTSYPQETPTGAACKAQSCIGVDNPGDFEIHFSIFDGTGTEQSAVFSLSTE